MIVSTDRQTIDHDQVIINALVDANVLFEGPYTTSSGFLIPAGGFIERVFGIPELNQQIVKSLAKTVAQKNIDCLLGCAMVGVPFASNIAYENQIAFGAIRKQSTSHGVITSIAGLVPDDAKTVAIFDDWNGGWNALKEFYGIVSGYDITPSHIISIVESFEDSETRASIAEFLESNDLQFYAACTFRDIIDEYYRRDRLTQEAYELLIELLENPQSYAASKQNIERYIELKKQGKTFIGESPKTRLEAQLPII